MPTPEFILHLRQHIGHAPLWLSGASAVVLRDGEHGPDVLLVRRADSLEWAEIGGIVEPGEHPAETVVREAREEAGVRVTVERLLWVAVDEPVLFPNGDQCQFLNHGFLARWVAGEGTVADDESVAVGWFPVDALPEPRRADLAARVRHALTPPREVLFEAPGARAESPSRPRP